MTELEPRMMEMNLILDNLRSAFNVGNIFRTAEALRIQEIIGCGYTALPPHPKLAKTSRGCDQLVSSRHCPSSSEAAASARQQGRTVVAVETTSESRCFWDWRASFPLTLIFGNEALGISRDTLEQCHAIVSLPNYGRKNSINVGNCAAAVMYEARRQWELARPSAKRG